MVRFFHPLAHERTSYKVSLAYQSWRDDDVCLSLSLSLSLSLTLCTHASERTCTLVQCSYTDRYHPAQLELVLRDSGRATIDFSDAVADQSRSGNVVGPGRTMHFCRPEYSRMNRSSAQTVKMMRPGPKHYPGALPEMLKAGSLVFPPLSG
jgi:hypothetical protein